MRPLLLRVEDAAEALAIGRRKAYDLIMRGELPSVLIGRCRRVPVSAVERFIEGRLLA